MSKPPIQTFKVWPFSVALWEKENRRFVSVSKSQKKDGEYKDDIVWLNLSEVSCLASLLNRMEQAVVNEETQF